MPGLRGFLFKHWDPVGDVREAIESWPTTSFSNEKEAEDSLFAFLEEKFDGLEVLRQFAYDRIKADILIERAVAIELKVNLLKTSEFQRLVGQLETYAKWKVGMVVVVVGELDTDLRRRIENRLISDWEEENAACLIHCPVGAGA